MKWEKISNGIGIGLVALCFVIALARVVKLRMAGGGEVKTGDPVTLRVAYFQLEGGVREALEAVAKRYTELHPNVRIVPMPIPEKIFKNWRITQLVGGTPPDLMQLGSAITEEQLARYFLPIGELASRPNPYNRGTALEKTPLRETFFDGMQAGLGIQPGLNSVQVEYYGVPATAGTIRMFYNLDLLEEITGSRRIPRNYGEFAELCRKTNEFARRTGRPIVPVGGANYNAYILMDYLFSGQTQKLLQEKINKPGQLSALVVPARVAKAYWNGRWSLQSPEVRSGMALVQAVAKEMQPGFAQLQRDDAILYFSQGGAVMIPSGTWDAITLRSFSPFALGTGMLPLPDAADPEYGRFTYGLFSEADQGAGFTLGIPRDGAHPEIARDFLLFMGSQAMNKVWTDTSKWPPAIVGVEPSPEARDFTPREGGYPGGFPLNNLGSDSRRVYLNKMYLLAGPGASAEKFLAAIEPDFSPELEKDMRRLLRANTDSLRRSDSVEASAALRVERDPAQAERLDLLIEARTAAERGISEIRNTLVNKPSAP